MSTTEVLSIALASGLLKVAANKLVPLVTSEFVSIKGVTKGLSELQDIHGLITSSMSMFHGREIDGYPSFQWVIKLKNVADDIDDLLHEVHLEAVKDRIESDGKGHAIVDCIHAKPKSFMFRCKIARKIKAIKEKFAAIVKQISDANAILNSFPLDHSVRGRNIRAGEMFLLANIEESKLPRRDQKNGMICKPIETYEGEDGWTIVTKNQGQSS